MNGTRIIDTNGNMIESRSDLLGRKLSYSDPDLGTWTYSYDINGNLDFQTDAKGNTTTFSYDLLNRLLSKTSDTTTNYAYDESGHGFSIGKLTTVSYSGGSESYIYDERGRIISVTQQIGSKSATESFTYDSLDRLVKTTYPTGEEVYNSYDENLNLQGMGHGTAFDNIDYFYVNNYEYKTTGRIAEMTFGNGLRTVYNYYDNNVDLDPSANTYKSYNLKSINLYNNAGLMITTNYQYDKMGNIKNKFMNDVPANLVTTEEYSYDEFNRLISSASYGVHGYNQAALEIFEYDELNNITRKYKEVDEVVDDRNYLYHSTKIHAVVNDSVYTYQYDNNGNMTGRFQSGIQNRGFQYDKSNRVLLISDGGSYSYNAQEQRILKNENGKKTYYFFQNYEEEVSATETAIISYYFANGQRIAKRTQIHGENDSVLVYIHSDHLQSATRVTDSNGLTVQTVLYTAFGETGFMSGTQELKYTYTDQEFESNGLMYYGARFYDPALGRFLQADTILDGLNRYAYCGNNPVNYIDPSGNLAIIDDILFWAIGSLTGTRNDGFFEGVGQNFVESWKVVGDTALEVITTIPETIIDTVDRVTNADDFGQGCLEVGRGLLELVQTSGHILNEAIGTVFAYGTVEIFGGVTEQFEDVQIVKSDTMPATFTLGNKVIANKNVVDDPVMGDWVKAHEQGHYRQSKITGILYLPIIAIPSVGNNIANLITGKPWSDKSGVGRYRAYHTWGVEAWANELSGNSIETRKTVTGRIEIRFVRKDINSHYIFTSPWTKDY